MSALPSDTPGEASRRRGFVVRMLTLDGIAKVVGLVVAIFGIGKFFSDRAESAAAATRARSIGYVESYAAPTLLDARQKLYAFWATEPGLVSALGSGALSERQYAAMLQAAVFRPGKDTAVREPLLILDSFYGQLSFCRKSGLCDTAILDSYFCEVSRRNAMAYRPFYDRLAEVTGDSSIGRELQSFAAACEAA